MKKLRDFAFYSLSLINKRPNTYYIKQLSIRLKSMKRNLLCACLLALSLTATAQDNHGYGASDGQFKSLSEEIAKLKKHNDMFNVYFNYAASAQVEQDAKTGVHALLTSN